MISDNVNNIDDADNAADGKIARNANVIVFLDILDRSRGALSRREDRKRSPVVDQPRAVLDWLDARDDQVRPGLSDSDDFHCVTIS